MKSIPVFLITNIRTASMSNYFRVTYNLNISMHSLSYLKRSLILCQNVEVYQPLESEKIPKLVQRWRTKTLFFSPNKPVGVSRLQLLQLPPHPHVPLSCSSFASCLLLPVWIRSFGSHLVPTPLGFLYVLSVSSIFRATLRRLSLPARFPCPVSDTGTKNTLEMLLSCI